MLVSGRVNKFPLEFRPVSNCSFQKNWRQKLWNLKNSASFSELSTDRSCTPFECILLHALLATSINVAGRKKKPTKYDRKRSCSFCIEDVWMKQLVGWWWWWWCCYCCCCCCCCCCCGINENCAEFFMWCYFFFAALEVHLNGRMQAMLVAITVSWQHQFPRGDTYCWKQTMKNILRQLLFVEISLQIRYINISRWNLILPAFGIGFLLVLRELCAWF